MQTNQNIKVIIAGRPYNLSVKIEEEELVRKAAEQLNETIKNYSQTFEYKDHQDLFAMVALQNVANAIRIEDEKSFKDEEMEQKLSELDKMLSENIDN